MTQTIGVAVGVAENTRRITGAAASGVKGFRGGEFNRHGRGLNKIRAKQILDELLADFGEVAVADRLILSQVSMLMARAERANITSDEAVRLAGTSGRLLGDIRRRMAKQPRPVNGSPGGGDDFFEYARSLPRDPRSDGEPR
jgi:hypothetical protein